MSEKVEQIALPQTQAARAIGVTDRTLRNWERRGLIAGRRAAGGVKLYPVSELRRLAGEDASDGKPVQQ